MILAFLQYCCCKFFLIFHFLSIYRCMNSDICCESISKTWKDFKWKESSVLQTELLFDFIKFTQFIFFTCKFRYIKITMFNSYRNCALDGDTNKVKNVWSYFCLCMKTGRPDFGLYLIIEKWSYTHDVNFVYNGRLSN